MLIRHLEFADLDELLVLYGHLHGSDAPLPERAVVEGVWRELAGNPSYRYYGGFAGGSLVSSCALTIIPNLTRGCRSYGVIENVVTHVAHRRKGYAKAVLLDALNDAWAANCYKVMLLTGRKDEATLRFYESVGFDRHGKQAFIASAAGSQLGRGSGEKSG